jgi:hypothetical protein
MRRDVEQALPKYLAVSDHDYHLWGELIQFLNDRAIAKRFRLQHSQTHLQGRQFDGRRGKLPPVAPRRAVWLGDYRRNLESVRRQSPE